MRVFASKACRKARGEACRGEDTRRGLPPLPLAPVAIQYHLVAAQGRLDWLRGSARKVPRGLVAARGVRSRQSQQGKVQALKFGSTQDRSSGRVASARIVDRFGMLICELAIDVRYASPVLKQ